MNDAGGPDPTLRATYVHWSPEKIRFGDLDRHNHLNNVALCAMLENGRVEFRERLVPEVARDEASAWLLVTIAITFLGSMSYPGVVDIGTRPVRVGRSSYELAQGAFDGARCLATARVKTVHADRRTLRSRPVPAAFRAVMLAESAAGDG
ncbi:MAG: acyl-CoA thioesterase [Alphaproteobacteria bacterium]|nr:acyl-CoA thioesterase [Alphaproteobacteria bacterium]